MTMKELLGKLRKYEIRIRKTINTRMQGDYHSVFKGSGLEFTDVRDYQYGDDVRSIDWNVSAKGHGTFVKVFHEEKEQNVVFLVDVSASQQIGPENRKKLDITKEICGVLTLSAVKEKGHVGLICFSDRKELYIPPEKGEKQAYNIIYHLFNLYPTSSKTNLSKALQYTLGLLKRKSVVILISDFIDLGYEHHLNALAKKHDLVVIHVSDKREVAFPKLGIIPLLDKETKKTIWVNSSSNSFRNHLHNQFKDNQKKLQEICLKLKVNYLWVGTNEDYVQKLVQLFRIRHQY